MSGIHSGSTTVKSASALAWSAARESMLGITFLFTASSSKRRMWQIVPLYIWQISHSNITCHSDRTVSNQADVISKHNGGNAA